MATTPTRGSDGLTPGDRQALRALVKRRFAMLRQEVRRREVEMKAEVDIRLAEKYRQDEVQFAAMQSEQEKARDDFRRAMQEIAERYSREMPGWQIGVNQHGNQVGGHPVTRAQERAALLSAIPVQVQQAEQQLDRQEMDLLEKLTLGGLQSAEATAFIESIPTVAALIPSSRLRELEQQFEAGGPVG